jgi:WD40 repeat protein
VARRCPYVGLVPYQEVDEAYFFGREREAEVIAANLLTSRLTVLYGPSGVGKSSTLRAAVIPRLRRQAELETVEGGLAEYHVLYFAAWRDDPQEAMGRFLSQSLGSLLSKGAAPPTNASFTEALQGWTEATQGDLLIIFDQFDEYCLYHPVTSGGFDADLVEALNHPDLTTNLLISIREDAVAKLDRFKGRIPGLFSNYLRLRNLSEEAARRAIVEPIGAFNRLGPADQRMVVEPELTDAVLQQVRAGRVVVGGAGHGTAAPEASDGDGYVEAAHLQLVMTRLWMEEEKAGSRVLRLATLERLGGAETIVRAHLDDSMAALGPMEQDLAADVFHHLVTPSGAKVAHTAGDLASYADVPEEQLSPVLERLAASDLRILRTAPPPLDRPGESQYEIFHDVLGPAVLDWRLRHVQARREAENAGELIRQKQEAEERARLAHRRAARVSAFAVGLVMLLVVLLAMGVLTWRKQREITSRRLAAEALAELPVDPVRAQHTALRAYQSAHTDEAESVLRRSLTAPVPFSVLKGHDGPINSVAFSPDGTRLVTTSNDDTARIWNTKTGAPGPILKHTDDVYGATFDTSGRRVVTTGNDGARTWDAATGRSDQFVRGGVLAIDPAGTHALMLDDADNEDKTARLWDLVTGDPGPVLAGHESFLTAAALGQSGTRLVTADYGGTVRVWDVVGGAVEGRTLESPPGRSLTPLSLALSPDGQMVAAGDLFGAVELWDLRSGGAPIVYDTLVHEASSTVQFTPNGNLIIVGDKLVWYCSPPFAASADGCIPAVGHSDWTLAASTDSKEERLLTASEDGTARVWDIGSWQSSLELRGHGDAVVSAAFDPVDPSVIATGGHDGTARLWRLPEQTAFVGSTNRALSAALSDDGKVVASGSSDGWLRIWNAPNPTATPMTMCDECEAIGQVEFNSDDTTLLTVDGDQLLLTARIWDWRSSTQKASKTFLLPRGFVGASFVPGRDDKLLIPGLEEGDKHGVAVWDWKHDTTTWLVLNAEVTAAALDPADETLVAVADFNGHVQLWDSRDHRKIRDLGQISLVSSIDFSQDGKRVLTASGDGTARVWDVAGGPPVELVGQEGPLNAAAFSDDGRKVVTGSANGTTTVWDAEHGRLLEAVHYHSDSVNSVQIVKAGSGYKVLSAGDDLSVLLYPCDLCVTGDELLSVAKKRIGD